jgi:hypothetical protein
MGGVDETSLFERTDALRGPLQPWDAARMGGLNRRMWGARRGVT